ncbi:MAG TPA: tetratricopeptide repeat protein [Verrucomicrobiae bacterium]|nr:tetratricopeptide repeat protein [Verrucomicrobiae bacterium]
MDAYDVACLCGDVPCVYDHIQHRAITFQLLDREQAFNSLKLMLSPSQTRRLVRGTIAGIATVGLISIWWLCSQNPDIDFLGQHGSAAWIVYPKPANGAIHRSEEWSAVFRRSFTIDHAPTKATLSLRAFKSFEVRINGMLVDATTVSSAPASDLKSEPGLATPDWKSATELDVTGTLRSGTNEISVSVTNNRGPPALWLSLQADAFKLNTDGDWQSSLSGAAWRNARPASQPMEIGPGNPFFGGENAFEALGKEWRTLLVFALIAAAMVIGGAWWARGGIPIIGRDSANPRCGLVLGVFLIVVVLWVALFINNLGQLPRRTGFDLDAHLDYIGYIRTHHALPLATDGWEMCQPPLYYLASAVLLSATRVATASDAAVHVLRVFGLVIGIAHVTLIFLSLRLLFPGQMKNLSAGLLLAAFLPENLYISHYVTNEGLSALFISASIYFCLRILTQDESSWRLFLAVGLCLGAALLTKITALFAAPFIFGALGARLATGGGTNAPRGDGGDAKQPFDSRVWLRTLGVAVAVTFIVCGWHYLRVWKHFGSPVVHDWDPASGFAWWTDPGFQTGAYLTRFGGSLTHPFYSVFHGWGDGLYSTLWGDGLCGGVIRLDRRPPWNYELMAAGYLLALVPTALIVIGIVVAAVRFFRRPEPIYFLLLGVPCLTFAGLVYMNLKLPFYCNVKAFYCLTAILPLCALGTVGWDAITRATCYLRPVLWVLLVLWAIFAYASFWIRAGTPLTRTTQAWYLAADGRNEDAAREFSKVLDQNPHDAEARKGLGLCLWQENRLDEARAQTVQALTDDQNGADGHLQLASILARQDHLDDAVREAQTAITLAPDMAASYVRLCGWLSRLKRWPEAISAGSEGLRVEPMNAELRFDTGVALAALGKHADAAAEFRAACEFKPSWADAHDKLGLSLSLLNQWPEAAMEFDTACGLKPSEPSLLFHLALASQATGQTRKAIVAYRQTLRLDPDSLPALNNLAWILATDSDPQLRNGPEAVRLAERARQLGGAPDASRLQTLAAAYAEAGRFSEAITTADEALKLPNQAAMAAALRQQLELYRQNRPYHQEPSARH